MNFLIFYAHEKFLTVHNHNNTFWNKQKVLAYIFQIDNPKKWSVARNTSFTNGVYRAKLTRKTL